MSTQTTVNFQQGVDGYSGTVDTYLRQSKPTTAHGASAMVSADGDAPTGSGQDDQGLLMFTGLFGLGRIPLGAKIVSATLTLNTTNTGDGAAVYRMLRGWTDAATWDSLGGGIQANGSEAAAVADWSTGRIGATGAASFDVTASLQAWAAAADPNAANQGWALLPLGGNGWDFHSAQGTVTPKLTVVYETGTSSSPSLALGGPVSLAEGGSGSTTAFAFTVTRSGDTSGATTADWAVAGGATNPAGAADFTGGVLPTGTVSFAAGETSRTITVNVAGDGLTEPDETFTLTLSNPSGGATIAQPTATGTIRNDDGATAPFDESYIATTFTGGRWRNLEHGNAAKAFFTNGDWYALLPDGAKWGVERFDGPVPAAGQQGGWTRVSSDTFQDTNRSSDIAWDEAADKLYVLQYWNSSGVQPTMYKLGYDPVGRSFFQEAQVQVSGTGGKLPSTHWGANAELVIGMDRYGTPLVADVGEATSGSNVGVHFAWASKDLATWGEVRIDSIPTAAYGNSKVDIVSFAKNGVDYIGVAYSADNPATSGVAGDVWKFAWHRAETNPANYATGWQIETFNSTVAIDNHISVVWSGSDIFIAMKDDQDRVWMTKGLPGDLGSWAPAVQVTPKGPSRPTLVVDETDNRVLVFYQQGTSTLGDIYMKSVSQDGPLTFDPTSLGTRVMDATDGTRLSDPQGIAHAVDAGMDGMFPLLAANADSKQIWYNRLDLGSPEILV